MIQVNMGRTILQGDSHILCAEMECLLKSFREMLEKKYSKEMAEELFNMVVEGSKMTEEEIEKEHEELKAQAKEIMKDIFKGLMKGLGE